MKKTKPKMHIAHEYLMNPTHAVTVNLIGCGGTGSQVLACLGRISHSLKALGHPGLHVTTYDPDTVSEANTGRQLFSPSDTGLNKAVLLTGRLNAFFGTAWEAVPGKFAGPHALKSNITFSCVDSVKSRMEIAGVLQSQSGPFSHSRLWENPFYWIDFGNGAHTGQVVFGTLGEIKQPKSGRFCTVPEIPVITQRFDLTKVREEDSGPSCSLAEALQKQDLFINSVLAHVGSDLIWKLLSEGMIDKAGMFLNLKTACLNPIGL